MPQTTPTPSESASASLPASEPEPAPFDQTTIDATGRPWEHAVLIGDAVAEQQLLPLKKSCGNHTLTWEMSTQFPSDVQRISVQTVNQKESLRIDNIATDAGTDLAIDAAFLPNCKQLILLAEHADAIDVYRYDIATKKWNQLTTNLSEPIVDLESPPSVHFLYPIDDQRLLIAATNPHTGSDAHTSMDSQGIFDLRTTKIEWINNPTNLGPAIYNDAGHVLSVLTSEANDDRTQFSIIRKDFKLPTSKPQTTVVASHAEEQALFTEFFAFHTTSCFRTNFYSAAAYTACMDGFWKKAFPAGTKTE
jgi:hypothetical protein